MTGGDDEQTRVDPQPAGRSLTSDEATVVQPQKPKPVARPIDTLPDDEDEATRRLKVGPPKSIPPLAPEPPRAPTSLAVKTVRKIPPPFKVAALLALLGLVLLVLDTFRDRRHSKSPVTNVTKWFNW